MVPFYHQDGIFMYSISISPIFLRSILLMATGRKISVLGLGYVGLIAAITFGKFGKVIAFDINPQRVRMLQSGHDVNGEIPSQDLINTNIHFTHQLQDLKEANFYIIAVPTPLDHYKNPDLSSILNASEIIAKILKKGDVVVYESSVYPGATEEECIPLLEKISKMSCGVDFFVGFSPERINPSDKLHTIETIPKIVSGINDKALNVIADVYSNVIKAGVFRVSSIRTAEAIKIIENTQRDINIAYMNEIAMILHKLGIDTAEVIAGMKTKWNYIPFQPGLVGGHCIGVNSYYLLYKAKELGYYSSLIMATRFINEIIAKFIVYKTIKNLIRLDISVRKAKIAILGFTYKENCSDSRDTKVIDIINELQSYGIKVMVHDPIADHKLAKKIYNIQLQSWDSLNSLDAIIITVSHTFYLNLDKNELKKKLNNHGLIMDIKNIINMKDFTDTNIMVWKL